MVKSSPITRRGALKLGAAATALPLVHIRSGRAAGKMSVAFWDHWVPKGNDVLQSQVDTWAKQNQVDVTVDFITGNGGKLQTTGVAESMAKTGHDIFTFAQWDVHNVSGALAPVDDLMQRIIAKNGAVNEIGTYLAKSQGHWAAVPTTTGTQTKPPCARISWFKKHGLDVQAMYPVKPEHTALQDAWTYDEFMKYAEIAKKDDMGFALGLGGFTNTDGIDQVGSMFRAYGAALVDKEGTIQVKSDAMKQFLEFAQKIVKFYPDAAPSYDDASNNRALISGKSALICNPPSAWSVAKRDAPEIAADCWTFSSPSGPKGRFVPVLLFFWGIWSFSQNKKPAAELIEYLLERKQAEARSDVVNGYDIPPYANMLDFKIWETVEPPPGTVYNYPIRPWHKAEPSLTASEAQPDVAVQIYNRAVHNNMLAQLKGGKPIPEVISWAQNELEGFVR
jgi:ABC-type glycerol-3-phosphate transport system substrate-binding protein